MPLIVLEGVDGCGKSTQLDLLQEYLHNESIPFRFFRDPGGTTLGENIREILLDKANDVGRVAELFGYLLSRAQLVHEVLAPALAAEELIVMDRFYPSTLAYQAFGLGLDRAQVQAAIDLCVDGVHPDCCIWFDLPVAEGARRRAVARGEEDRIEARGLAYLEKVHAGYAQMASEGLIARCDASGSKEVVHERVLALLQAILPTH